MGGAMEKLQLDLEGPDPRRGLSGMAKGLIGSEILRIASEIRTAITAGQKIANFTVGDFSSREFPIPDCLRDGTLRALAAGETNYPPSDGVLRLRKVVPGMRGWAGTKTRRRDRAGERPLYLLYDQFYWMLPFGSARHEIPVRALPEVARYTVLVDGISKAFAATGVRVGWCI